MSTAGEAGSLKNIRGKPAMDKHSGIFPWEIDREVNLMLLCFGVWNKS